MIRKLVATIKMLILVSLISAPISAYSAQSYVKLYNYTDAELTVYVDDVNLGAIPTGDSPNWIPAPYGLHKVEAYKTGSWHCASKYCETSYSYPNADVQIGKYDL